MQHNLPTKRRAPRRSDAGSLYVFLCLAALSLAGSLCLKAQSG